MGFLQSYKILLTLTVRLSVWRREQVWECSAQGLGCRYLAALPRALYSYEPVGLPASSGGGIYCYSAHFVDFESEAQKLAEGSAGGGGELTLRVDWPVARGRSPGGSCRLCPAQRGKAARGPSTLAELRALSPGARPNNQPHAGRRALHVWGAQGPGRHGHPRGAGGPRGLWAPVSAESPCGLRPRSDCAQHASSDRGCRPCSESINTRRSERERLCRQPAMEEPPRGAAKKRVWNQRGRGSAPSFPRSLAHIPGAPGLFGASFLYLQTENTDGWHVG